MTSEAADRVIELYERHAGAWSRDRGDRLVEQEWLDRFLALLPCDASVLDVGCGSGVPARYLIEKGCRLTGVDSSTNMITMCRNHFPQQDWHVADMRTLILKWTFDGILAWDSFFHLPPADQRRMFAVFKRHAASGAALMFTSGPSHGERIGAYRGEPLYHASLDSGEYRSLLESQGFEVAAHVIEDPTCELRTIWLARLEQSGVMSTLAKRPHRSVQPTQGHEKTPRIDFPS